jgi:hypothetical protein
MRERKDKLRTKLDDRGYRDCDTILCFWRIEMTNSQLASLGTE